MLTIPDHDEATSQQLEAELAAIRQQITILTEEAEAFLAKAMNAERCLTYYGKKERREELQKKIDGLLLEDRLLIKQNDPDSYAKSKPKLAALVTEYDRLRIEIQALYQAEQERIETKRQGDFTYEGFLGKEGKELEKVKVCASKILQDAGKMTVKLQKLGRHHHRLQARLMTRQQEDAELKQNMTSPHTDQTEDNIGLSDFGPLFFKPERNQRRQGNPQPSCWHSIVTACLGRFRL